MEGELSVLRNVNTILPQQCDDGDAYSRGSCMTVMCLPNPDKENSNVDNGNKVMAAVAKESTLVENEFK